MVPTLLLKKRYTNTKERNIKYLNQVKCIKDEERIFFLFIGCIGKIYGRCISIIYLIKDMIAPNSNILDNREKNRNYN